MRQRDPAAFGVPVGGIKIPLDSGQEVEVPIDTGRGGELAARNVGGGIPPTGALGPELVALGAGEGTCAGGATGTAIFGRIDVTGCSRNRVS